MVLISGEKMDDTMNSVLRYTVTPKIVSQWSKYLNLTHEIIKSTWKNYGRVKMIILVGKPSKCDTKRRSRKDIVDIFKYMKA